MTQGDIWHMNYMYIIKMYCITIIMSIDIIIHITVSK